MSSIQYYIVQENDPLYELVEGDYFANFDTLQEFKYQINRYFPNTWNIKEISRRENGPRAESLIKCTFTIPNSSQHPFYIYLCQFEGGGRRNMPYEQRIQFREHSKWIPDLNTLNIANTFHECSNADNAECYIIGIYKRSEKDHDVIFTGIHPHWMYDKRIESESTSPTSFQVKIYPIQNAYRFGQAIFTKDDGQRAICFKPYKILWYMANRDKLHLEDLNKVKMMIDKLPQTAESRQQIFYGAPGTGKSHTIKVMTKGEDVIRTTFHPDTDYSTFVGAYKPTTVEETVMTVIGTKAVPVEDADGNERKESKIIYEFVPQSFLQAYISAWRKYADSENGEPKKQFLVVEEINRGNCAQVFGDLFQLLDRNEHGFSEYPIRADADMKKQLQKAFKGLDIPQRNSINAIFDGRDIVKEVLEGNVLLLPSNLYILATMNTSDQSLFPIDSAFKRRWDWKYVPISNANHGWLIHAGGKSYDWWQFIERINDLIGQTTNSEDKKLGYFFCKAKDGVIPTEMFVGKVIFYLWNDVFKDYDFCDQVFNDANGNKLSFDRFYTNNGNESNVMDGTVEVFLKNLKMEPVNDEHEEITEQGMSDQDSPATIQDSRDYTRYSINGEGKYSKSKVATELVRKYIAMNPDMLAEDVVSNWKRLGISVPHFIETKAEYDARTDNSKRSEEINCNGSTVYVTWNGWSGKMKELEDAIGKQDWGLDIQEISE